MRTVLKRANTSWFLNVVPPGVFVLGSKINVWFPERTKYRSPRQENLVGSFSYIKALPPQRGVLDFLVLLYLVISLLLFCLSAFFLVLEGGRFRNWRRTVTTTLVFMPLKSTANFSPTSIGPSLWPSRRLMDRIRGLATCHSDHRAKSKN